MIVVKIELWPKGDEKLCIVKGVILIANNGTGDINTGNYNYTVVTGKNKKYAEGSIMNFPRKRLLAFDLVYRVLKQIIGERNDGGVK